MDCAAFASPAEMLFADAAANAAADEVPTYDPASTTPQSLMNELPPRPPSPYKAMQHNTHRSAAAKATVTSSFLRGRRNVLALSAASIVPSALVGEGEQPSGGSEWSASAMRSLVLRHTKAGDSAVVYADAETHDSAMQQYVFYGLPRQRLVEREESERNALLATEEVVFTGLYIQALQARAELLAGNEAEELVVAAALQRAEARQEMLKVIEVEVAARLREQRLSELLEVQFQALLPAHNAGYHRIEAEEREDLRSVFQWHKEHRPLGPGCFIKGPEEDYRLRNVSRGTSAAPTSASSRSLRVASPLRSALTSALSSRELAEQLRKKTPASAAPDAALGELALLPSGSQPSRAALTQEGTFGAGEEAVYAEEGRLRLQAQKKLRHEELRERRRFTDLVEAQLDARQYVLAEEALCWMHLSRIAVDELYAAADRTRTRLSTEVAVREARAEREAERATLKEQLLRERGTQDERQNSGSEAAAVKDDALLPAKTTAATTTSDVSELESSSKNTTRRKSSPKRRKSNSTVADSGASTDASLDHLPEIEEESAADHEGNDGPLAHLRLITEETDSSPMCQQLTELSTTQTTTDVHDEL